MAKKRASMREGPLADLFRSTDESVPATRSPSRPQPTAGSGVEVALAEGDHRRAHSRPRPASRARPNSIWWRRDPPSRAAPVEEPPAEERPPPRSPPATRSRHRRAMIEPHKDPAVEADRAPPTRPSVLTRRPRRGPGRARGPRAPDGKAAARMSAPRSVAMNPTPHPRGRAAHPRGRAARGRRRRRGRQRGQPDGRGSAPRRRVRRDQHRPPVPAELERGHHPAHRLRAHPRPGIRLGPRVGYRAAFEEQDKIKQLLKGSDMVFLAAGAGGGTGTGAAPVVAKLARDVGALTVAAVSKPFAFEGARRAWPRRRRASPPSAPRSTP